MNETEHRQAAEVWVDQQNYGGLRSTRTISIETACLGGVTTLNPDTGDYIVWSVGYASRKTNGMYKRLKPRKVRSGNTGGANWRERRDATKEFRVN